MYNNIRQIVNDGFFFLLQAHFCKFVEDRKRRVVTKTPNHNW